MRKCLFDPETLLYELHEESGTARTIQRIAIVVLALGMVALYLWLYVSVFHFKLPKTAILEASRARWEAKMDLLSRELDACESVLTGIEERDDNVYRSIYGLDLLGVQRSGSPEARSFENDIVISKARIEDMMRRAVIQNESLDTVMVLAGEAGEMISCVPSIPPIMPVARVRMSSGFGGRKDPVYGGYEFHPGQDFACDKGTPIYATGDGVVVKAEPRFHGYGNMVIINHGYGYRTLYAHMTTIEVAAGMKVRRGERIGTVGRTGKATGPHLHYEVEYKGKRMNPMNYMDMSMPVEEYRSMIVQKQNDSESGKRISTTELLKRNRRNEN